MNPKNPKVLANPDAKGLDKAIESMRESFSQLTWLQKSFGRAFTLYREVSGVEAADQAEQRLVPSVYCGNKEYFDVLPNDNLSAFSFFHPVDPTAEPETSSTGTMRFQSLWTTQVDFICYLNYKNLGDSAPVPEKYIEQVLQQLKAIPEATVVNVWSNSLTQIWSGWDLTFLDRSTLYYPNGGFRMRLQVNYQYDCP
jgi:hypothetical protein